MNPKVSVIVPVYNVSKFIERCVRTLFEQTFDSIEYIFEHDCTPDNSIEILKGIILEYPKRSNAVQIIEHETNRGLAAARNTGLFASKGDYIQHIDSDDFIELDMIELLYKKAVEENADIVVSDFIFDWGTTKKDCIQRFDSDPLKYTNLLINGEVLPGVVNKMISRNLYTKNNIIALEGINMGEDYATTPKLTYHANKIAKVDTPLYHYCQTNPDAYTKNYTLTTIKSIELALNSLEVFFRAKKDFYLFSDSLKQGRLKKKIDMLLFSPYKYKKQIVNMFLDSHDIFKHSNLSSHEKIIFNLSRLNSLFFLELYVFTYNTALFLSRQLKL